MNVTRYNWHCARRQHNFPGYIIEIWAVNPILVIQVMCFSGLDLTFKAKLNPKSGNMAARWPSIHTSKVLLKFGLDIKTNLESRNHEFNMTADAHLESDIAEIQGASPHSHKQHARQICSFMNTNLYFPKAVILEEYIFPHVSHRSAWDEIMMS